MSQKISQLPAVISANINDTDILPIVASNITSKVTVANLRTKLGTQPPLGGRTVTDTFTYLTNNAVFNVKDYGAFGDGVTDDTTAINAAITQALVAGGIVYFPLGTYKTSATLNVTAAEVHFAGQGRGTKIKPTTAAFNVITLSINAHRFKLLDMWIQGNATTNGTTQFGVFTGAFAAPDDVEIAGCMFGNTVVGGGSLNSGIKIDGGNNWNIHDCRFKYLWGSISNTGYGVLAGTSVGVHVHDCYFWGTTGRGRHAVYLSGGCTYADVHDNYSEGMMEEAFPMYSQGAQPASMYNHVHHNTVNGGGQLTATGAAFSIFGNAKYNKLDNNHTIGYQGAGYTINRSGETGGTTDNIFEANTAEMCAWIGFWIVGAAKTTMRGNTARDIGQASSGTYAAFDLRADAVGGTTYSTDTTFIGNRAYGATLRAALIIQEAGNTGTVALNNDWPQGQVDKIKTNGAPLVAKTNNVGIKEISANNGDSNVTLNVFVDAEIESFDSALTANRTVTLTTNNVYEGARFKIVRTGLGAFTLDVGGLKTIPAGTAAIVEVQYSQQQFAAWRLVGYSPL
jgi:hypothetical protein